MTDRQTRVGDWVDVHLTGTPDRRPTDAERDFGESVDDFEATIADVLSTA